MLGMYLQVSSSCLVLLLRLYMYCTHVVQCPSLRLVASHLCCHAAELQQDCCLAKLEPLPACRRRGCALLLGRCCVAANSDASPQRWAIPVWAMR